MKVKLICDEQYLTNEDFFAQPMGAVLALRSCGDCPSPTGPDELTAET
jgi:hypothetical protein